MPEMQISEEQREYLDGLRADLEERYVGKYGAVRPRDALQFLIDRYEADVQDVLSDLRDDGETGASDGSEGSDASAASDDPAGEPDRASADADDGEDAGDGTDRLQAMMALLETHDDKWEETGSEEEKYAVTLPDGETERARTKDDVRALLFQHYG